jgi:hypothetical protein
MITRFPKGDIDEIFYSMCARYYDNLQYDNKTTFLHDLFDKYIQPSIGLPHRLGYLVNKLSLKRFFTVDHLIDQHTLFPYYHPFLFEERAQQLREKMITGNEQLIHKTVGQSTTNIPNLTWLRYCPLCAKEERIHYGECYWHRLHQVPGVEICPIHRVFLENSKISVRRCRSDFIPAEQAVMSMNARQATSSPFYEFFLGIAEDTRYLLQHPSKSLSSHFIREQYQALLAHHGFITPGGQVRTIELLQAFLKYYPQEFLAQLHCELKLTPHLHNAWVSEVIHETGFQHPLHHILVIRFLKSTMEPFLYQRMETPKPFGCAPWPCLNPACELYRKRCITTCQTATGVKGNLFARFTCKCGFTYYRSGPDCSPEDMFKKDRILCYGSIWEMKLREMWGNPDLSLCEIARRLGVNTDSANRYAAKIQLPVPRNPLRSARYRVGEKRGRTSTRSIEWYEAKWLELIEEYPEASAGVLRQKMPGIYNHLKKYDQDWFLTHCPAKKPGGRPESRSKLINSSGKI